MRVSRFRVSARLDMASRESLGTVTIERTTLDAIVTVRPYRRKRVYAATLSAIASAIVRDTIRQEVREKKAARRARRKASR